MTSIRIFNPNEKPFGPLSNNFYFPMLFPGDPKKYKSVTSYIYANLSKAENQYLLVNTPVKDVFKVLLSVEFKALLTLSINGN